VSGLTDAHDGSATVAAISCPEPEFATNVAETPAAANVNTFGDALTSETWLPPLSLTLRTPVETGLVPPPEHADRIAVAILAAHIERIKRLKCTLSKSKLLVHRCYQATLGSSEQKGSDAYAGAFLVGLAYFTPEERRPAGRQRPVWLLGPQRREPMRLEPELGWPEGARAQASVRRL
jgi:hypothetical protein